jgi:hypothetical protein
MWHKKFGFVPKKITAVTVMFLNRTPVSFCIYPDVDKSIISTLGGAAVAYPQPGFPV